MFVFAYLDLAPRLVVDGDSRGSEEKIRGFGVEEDRSLLVLN